LKRDAPDTDCDDPLWGRIANDRSWARVRIRQITTKQTLKKLAILANDSLRV
jgi:hypothetical protein